MVSASSVLSEMKHKHPITSSPGSSVKQNSEILEHINNVANEEEHQNDTDYCHSSDSSDERCNKELNWKGNSERLILQRVDDWIKMSKKVETKELYEGDEKLP